MIGSLRGSLIERPAENELLVEVGGVGYRTVVPVPTAANAGSIGDDVFLYVHTHVREDAIVLYGFERAIDRSVFEALVGAHGVGPALALAVLSTLSAETVVRALAEGDADLLTTVPGIGKKTAARLVIDLANRFDGVATVPSVPGGSGTAAPDVRADVRVALGELGFAADEIAAALASLEGTFATEPDAPELLRAALRSLAVHRS